MAYKSDITALSPDHVYNFDGDYNDSVGTANGTNTGCIVTESGIAEDATNCMTTNGVADIVTLPVTTNIDDEVNRKAVGGFFITTAIQQPPVRIYGETSTTTGFTFHMGFGNNVTFEVDYGTVLQIFGDTPLVANRAYHLLMKFESNTYGDEFSAYLDGVKQLDSADTSPGGVLTVRPAGEFGGKATGLAMGGTALKIVSPVNGKYNHWATWSGANALLTDTEIRQELFEKGALADTTITNQAGLDALADTVRPNAACCIRITGNGTIDLTADNVTFDPLASIHIQYTGTGTLNWTNTNGSNASIVSNIGGGTVNVINPSALTINGLENNTEIRVYDAGTTTEVAGQENVTTGTFTDTISVSNVDIRIVSVLYKNISYKNISMTNDVTIDVEQFLDRNFNNPA